MKFFNIMSSGSVMKGFLLHSIQFHVWGEISAHASVTASYATATDGF